MVRVDTFAFNAPLQFSSSGGGGGRYDDPDDDYYDDDDVGDASGPPQRRPAEQRPTAARRRTVSSDTDDRYWTDYLRIALPVIGLLLVIAVFWFWAQQLIDDDQEDVSPTEPGLAELVEEETAQATEPSTDGTETTPAGQSLLPPSTPEQQETPPTPTPSPQPAQNEPAGESDNQVDSGETGTSAIAPDMTVVVTEELNMRSEPTSSVPDNIVTTLAVGTELSVLSGPEEGDDFVWWQVNDPDGNTGWVVEDFIEPAGG